MSGVTREVTGADTVTLRWQMSDDNSAASALRPRLEFPTNAAKQFELLPGYFPGTTPRLDLPPGTTEWTASDLGLRWARVTVKAADEAGNVSTGVVSSEESLPSSSGGVVGAGFVRAWDLGNGNFLMEISPGTTTNGDPSLSLAYGLCVGDAEEMDWGERCGQQVNANGACANTVTDQGLGLGQPWRDLMSATGLEPTAWKRVIRHNAGITTPKDDRIVTRSTWGE